MNSPLKIQTLAVNGWADLKQSTDDGTYGAWLFATHAAADREVRQLRELGGDYRIVPASEPSAADLY